MTIKPPVFRKRRLVSTFAAANILAASTAFAQGAALEEVVVTAQKRAQSLQEVPIATSVFDASAIEQQGISDISDIGPFTPNVQVVESPSGGTQATIAIRGSVTFNPTITWESPVGMYLDGVFIGKNIGSIFDIVELERVEVLRGPQGTLYGKNTIGGAVNMITRKPSGEFGGKLKASAGNFDMYSVSASIDTPAVDLAGGSLSANISAFQQERDGFTKNQPDPFANPLANPRSSKEFKSKDSKVARLSLLWEGSDVDLHYSYDHSDTKATPTAAQLTDVPAGSGLDIGGGVFLPVDGVLSDYLSSDKKRARRISNDKSFYEDSETRGHALHLDWNLGELAAFGEVTAKSITAYRKLDFSDRIDIDGSPLDFFHSGRDINYDQFSQEFQIVGQTERTDYVLGLYYFNEEGDVLNINSFMPIYGFPTTNSEFGMENKTVAAFANVDWRPEAGLFNDRLTLSLGLRWTKEEKEQYIYHPDSSPVLPYTEADKSWTNVSPSFTASWEINDDTNIYGKIANGWKSGGFNGEAATQESFYQSYDPEEVTSYELGIKSRWLDNRLQINAAIFQNDLEEMQFSVFQGGATAVSTVDNAGEATIRGLELELLARPSDKLTISLNYGHLDPKYDEFLEVDPTTNQLTDFKNERDFPYAARNNTSASLEYFMGSFAWGEVTARLDWSYQGSYVPYVNPDQNRVSKTASYELLNARLTLAEIPLNSERQNLQLSVWGKNLTNEDYRVNTIPFGLWTTSYFGDPRTYGVDISYQF